MEAQRKEKRMDKRITFKDANLKAQTDRKMWEELKARQRKNQQNIIKLGKMLKERDRLPTDEAYETSKNMYEIAGNLLIEDMLGWLDYGMDEFNIDTEDALSLAHRLLEEYVNIRTEADEGWGSKEERKKLEEKAEHFYYAAVYMLRLADGSEVIDESW